MAASDMAKGGRLETLDSIRGLAALGVAVMHYGAVFNTPVAWSLLAPIYGRGWLFVDLFFSLSGYVLCHTYLSALNDRSHLRDFMIRRLARLYPLHFVTLMLCVGLQFVLADQGGYRSENADAYHFALNLLLLQNSGLQAGGSFNGISWSISCEFIINIVFAFWCIGSRRRWAVWVGLAAFALAMLMAEKGRIGEFEENYLWVFNSGLLRCALSFSLGVLVYRLGGMVAGIRGRWADAAFFMTLLLVIAGMALIGLHAVSERWDFALVALGFPSLIFFAARSEGPFTRLMRWRGLVWLGTVSYSIYLCHMFLIDLVGWLARKGWIPGTGSPATFGLFLATVLAVSAFAFHTVEVPGKHWMLRRLRRSLPMNASSAKA
ncbi:MAG: acyltransferase family protein [Betaproteobacteria bacterium]